MTLQQHAKVQNVAQFIDLPNVARSDIGRALSNVELPGELVLARAYGRFNLRKSGYYRLGDKLAQMGVRLVHCPPLDGQRGDPTDMAMRDDIWETLKHRSDIGCFVLCTGDGGFTGVVKLIRAYGHIAVVLGPPNRTSRRLIEAASIFLELSPHSEPMSGHSASPSQQKSQPVPKNGNGNNCGSHWWSDRAQGPPSLYRPDIASAAEQKHHVRQNSLHG